MCGALRAGSGLASSPGVGLRGRPRAREDLVQAGERCLVQADLERAQRRLQLLHGPRADDRRGDGRLMEEPRESDVAGRVTQLVAEVLPLLDRRPVLVERVLGATFQAALA